MEISKLRNLIKKEFNINPFNVELMVKPINLEQIIECHDDNGYLQYQIIKLFGYNIEKNSFNEINIPTFVSLHNEKSYINDIKPETPLYELLTGAEDYILMYKEQLNEPSTYPNVYWRMYKVPNLKKLKKSLEKEDLERWEGWKNEIN